MSISGHCRACGDPADCYRGGVFLCKECADELVNGKIGPPPKPTAPAYQAGLCPRQRDSLKKMSS